MLNDARDTRCCLPLFNVKSKYIVTSCQHTQQNIVSCTEHRVSPTGLLPLTHIFCFNVHNHFMDDDTTKTKPKSDSGDGEGGGGGGSVKKAKLSETSHAIRSLNPYLSQPTIKAKVTWKGDMTSWNNAKGSGFYLRWSSPTNGTTALWHASSMNQLKSFTP